MPTVLLRNEPNVGRKEKPLKKSTRMICGVVALLMVLGFVGVLIITVMLS